MVIILDALLLCFSSRMFILVFLEIQVDFTIVVACRSMWVLRAVKRHEQL